MNAGGVQAVVDRLKDRVFPKHECPSESAAVWNVALHEMQKALATQQAQPQGGVVDAIDADNGFRRYPWTYENQPGNVSAWALGVACNKAAQASAGDPIDRGLGLLKFLQERGLGIVRVAALQPKEGGL